MTITVGLLKLTSSQTIERLLPDHECLCSPEVKQGDFFKKVVLKVPKATMVNFPMLIKVDHLLTWQLGGLKLANAFYLHACNVFIIFPLGIINMLKYISLIFLKLLLKRKT